MFITLDKDISLLKNKNSSDSDDLLADVAPGHTQSQNKPKLSKMIKQTPLKSKYIITEEMTFEQAKTAINAKIDDHIKNLEGYVEKQMQKWRTIKEKRAQELELQGII